MRLRESWCLSQHVGRLHVLSGSVCRLTGLTVEECVRPSAVDRVSVWSGASFRCPRSVSAAFLLCDMFEEKKQTQKKNVCMGTGTKKRTSLM